MFISAIAATAVLTAVVTSLTTSKRMRKKVAYMLDALEDKELNFRFDEDRIFGRQFNRTLNRLRNIFDKERHEIIEQEKYFGLMLDHVKTGVVVVEENGRIGYYNESGKITIALTASKATIGKHEVRVIAFNDISSEIAENEQQSWTKLIRVLTHEIMNTVTPIASLSETLMKLEGMDEEVRNGIGTISQSSRSLIRFVESYRNLTRVAAPVRKAFYVRELVERVISLTREQAVISGAICTYTEKSDDVLLYADEGQITQILINLVRNAVQAEARKIEITAEINISEHVIINVINDGRPISKESREEIFIPFFTTKQEGTGIGLSLSRQIMRLHNGTLNLTRSDVKGTVFTLVFK